MQSRGIRKDLKGIAKLETWIRRRALNLAVEEVLREEFL
jgi:hypothetical protein